MKSARLAYTDCFIKMKFVKPLIVVLISVASIKSDAVENSCSVSHQLDEVCGSYCYDIVKPLLRYADSIQSKEAQFTDLTGIIRSLEATVETLKGQIKLGDANQKCKLCNNLIVNQDLEISNLKSQVLGNATKVVELLAYKKEVDDKMKELNRQIKNQDLDISNLKSQVLGNATKVIELVASKKMLDDRIQYLTDTNHKNEVECNKQIENQDLEISNLKSQVSTNATKVVELLATNKVLVHQTQELIMKTNHQDFEISNLKLQLLKKETKVKAHENAISEPSRILPSSCVGKQSGLYEIMYPGESPFFVPCESNPTDSGWTVVQRRLDGSIEFNRHWHDYRVGFGNFSGEFFIGLDKLRLMTKSQQHELKVYLRDSNNEVRYAQYSNFLIGGEETQFKLISLGSFSGNGLDVMGECLNCPFSTLDKDSYYYCAARYLSGWWYKNICVGKNNLNGIYKTTFLRKGNREQTGSLSFVQMMIKPVYK